MKRRFSLFNLSLATRIIWAAILYAACVILQIAFDSFLIGSQLAVPAWLLLWMRPISNKPDDQGKEHWRPVGESEVHRIVDTIGATRRLRLRLQAPGYALIVVFLLVIALGVLLRGGLGHLSLAFFDLALFSFPAVFSGLIHLHTPVEITPKLKSFLTLMNADRPRELILTPYIRFDEDPDGNEIPEDLRFMLEPRRKPEALIGVQLQITMNNGPNGPVPYMYAVILTHGNSSPLYQRCAAMQVRGYEVEPGGDGEYGTVVIRQETSGTGYHTKEEDCLRLYQIVQEVFDGRPRL